MPLFNLNEFSVTAGLEGKLGDATGAQIIAEEKVKVVLAFPGLSEDSGADKQLVSYLVMKRCVIGQAVKDFFSRFGQVLLDVISSEGNFHVASGFKGK